MQLGIFLPVSLSQGFQSFLQRDGILPQMSSVVVPCHLPPQISWLPTPAATSSLFMIALPRCINFSGSLVPWQSVCQADHLKFRYRVMVTVETRWRRGEQGFARLPWPQLGVLRDCVLPVDRKQACPSSTRVGSPRERFDDCVNDRLPHRAPDLCSLPLHQWSHYVSRLPTTVPPEPGSAPAHPLHDPAGCTSGF